jgi:hypothetical protein
VVVAEEPEGDTAAPAVDPARSVAQWATVKFEVERSGDPSLGPQDDFPEGLARFDRAVRVGGLFERELAVDDRL